MTAWYAFDKYYLKTDDTAVYAAAVLLHPSRRNQYIIHNWEKKWQKPSVDAVQKLWGERYKNRLMITGFKTPTIPTADREPDEYDIVKGSLDVTTEFPDEDEFDQFITGHPVVKHWSTLNIYF
ncbi:hypothetical protein V1504DRAFT_464868 [Lipomyces starkeyi]